MNNISRREILAKTFEDTMLHCKTDLELVSAIEESKKKTRFYAAGDVPCSTAWEEKEGFVSVTKNRTFESAKKWTERYPNKKVAVLNFASATRPGGGVKNGSTAQEECLCRCSSLYEALDRRFLWDRFYGVNRSSGNPLHTDACIYTPNIVVFKTDVDFPELMKQEERYTVDVISCAAPNLRRTMSNRYNPDTAQPIRISSTELQRLHEQRARQILSVAADNNVDILVLGAFGCGAFQNNPRVVARAYENVLKTYRHYFDVVDFAVYCREYETENYDAFARCFPEQKTSR